MNISENQLNAADEFTKKVFELFLDDKAVHVETTISAIARMSGTFLLYRPRFQPSRKLAKKTIEIGGRNGKNKHYETNKCKEKRRSSVKVIGW